MVLVATRAEADQEDRFDDTQSQVGRPFEHNPLLANRTYDAGPLMAFRVDRQSTDLAALKLTPERRAQLETVLSTTVADYRRVLAEDPPNLPSPVAALCLCFIPDDPSYGPPSMIAVLDEDTRRRFLQPSKNIWVSSENIWDPHEYPYRRFLDEGAPEPDPDLERFIEEIAGTHMYQMVAAIANEAARRLTVDPPFDAVAPRYLAFVYEEMNDAALRASVMRAAPHLVQDLENEGLIPAADDFTDDEFS